jgi:hypothetical protein
MLAEDVFVSCPTLRMIYRPRLLASGWGRTEMMMRLMFCVLCLVMWSGTVSAQSGSNFDACVNDAQEKHTDSTMDNYTSWKCDGAKAQKLAVRPDSCSADARPTRIDRKTRQLEDGLYLRMTWSTRACAGMCEIRFYNDESKQTSYLCDVRRRTAESRPVSDDDRRPPRYYRRYPGEYYPPERRFSRPVREYDEPPPRRRRVREPDEDVRGRGRWIYDEPPDWRREWRRVYPRDEYRNVYRDDDRY